MSKAAVVWTDERKCLLHEHWGKRPASKIGLLIFGDTKRKNAVIGQAHRMDLGQGYVRPTSTTSAAERHRARRARMKAEGRVAPRYKRPPQPPEPKFVEAPKLSRFSCVWPDGDLPGGKFKFCGEPAQLGKPYCPDHVKLARPQRVSAGAQ